MADDGLLLNISADAGPQGFTAAKKKFKLSDKWKNRKAQKRQAQNGGEGPAPFKRKVSAPPPTEPPSKPQAGTPPRREKPQGEKPQGPRKVVKVSTKKTAGTPQPRPKTSSEDRAPEDRPFVKTSSLFRNNPDIPDINRPVVVQLKEKVFTSDSFSALELHPHLVSTLNNVLQVSSMTSVQRLAIPALLAGRDAVIRSQTGSGKTLAYGIPLVQSLQAAQPKITRSDGPRAVIVVPTRELAQQSFQIIQKLLKPFTWIVPGVLMGGEKRKSEKARLRKGINILISTPGRLVDHINNTQSISFSDVHWLILDEADRTLDLGFERDLTVILNALNAAASHRQTVLLSATLTEGVSRLAGITLKEPVSVQVSEAASSGQTEGAVTSDPSSLGMSESFAVPEKLQQHVVIVPSKLRLVCLAAFILGKSKLEETHKMIVFVSSCEAVEFLLSLFNSVLSGGPGGPGAKLALMRLHGNMEQEERTEVFQKFSQTKSGILLCTDVAARGLDLPQVTWIVQYNPPASPAEYVHRVGRTARIGARGSSLLFLTPSETPYLDVLADHNISMSETKVEDILTALALEHRFKGRGKYDKKSPGAAQQELRERATVLQAEFENVVHASAESVQTAKRALQSFLRSYTTYPSSLKHIFHIRTLHLGHTAKSFGLRDAPQGLGTGLGRGHASKTGTKAKDKRPPRKLSSKQREAGLLRSEYASGQEGEVLRKAKKRKKAGHQKAKKRMQ
ncbi:ATP-dependent DNA helicase DDX31 isoform X2 [Amia ocellicauda]